MLGTTFYNRDYSKRIQPWMGLKVNWLEWQALGGSAAGLLDVEPMATMADMVPPLRCPVEIWQDGGGLLWWGYVNSINGQGYQVSLDDLAFLQFTSGSTSREFGGSQLYLQWF